MINPFRMNKDILKFGKRMLVGSPSLIYNEYQDKVVDSKSEMGVEYFSRSGNVYQVANKNPDLFSFREKLFLKRCYKRFKEMRIQRDLKQINPIDVENK